MCKFDGTVDGKVLAPKAFFRSLVEQYAEEIYRYGWDSECDGLGATARVLEHLYSIHYERKFLEGVVTFMGGNIHAKSSDLATYLLDEEILFLENAVSFAQFDMRRPDGLSRDKGESIFKSYINPYSTAMYLLVMHWINRKDVEGNGSLNHVCINHHASIKNEFDYALLLAKKTELFFESIALANDGKRIPKQPWVIDGNTPFDLNS